VSPIPPEGYAVLDGSQEAAAILYCLTPGDEFVTEVPDNVAVKVSRPTIAPQCCSAAGDLCYRKWQGDCFAGVSDEIYPHITPMIFSEVAAVCRSYGLTMCKSNAGCKGCAYNGHPVYSDLPCATAAPSPPPLLPSPPSPPASPRPPPVRPLLSPPSPPASPRPPPVQPLLSPQQTAASPPPPVVGTEASLPATPSFPPPPQPTPPPFTGCWEEAPLGEHWCGTSHPGQAGYNADSGALYTTQEGQNWRRDESNGWRFCGLPLQECKAACMGMGDCAELTVVVSNGCCFPAATRCDGSSRSQDVKYLATSCEQSTATR